jgi:GT2 family glycosyltransferase
VTEKRKVFIIGSKGTPAKYGGFETFVDNLVSRQNSSQIKYFIACRRDLSDNKTDLYNYKEVDVNSGAFFAIRQTIFSKVGYFDSATFLYYEEQALTFKLQAQGYQNYLLLTSSYVHQGQGSTQLASRKVLGYYQQSRRYLLIQYLHAGKFALRFYDWTIKFEDVLSGDRFLGKN